MSRRALPLGRALAAKGHEVELVLPPWSCPQDNGRRWREGGVSIYNIDLPRSIPLLGHAIVVWRLLRRVLGGRPDVVHCFKPKAYAGLTEAVVWWLTRLRLADVRVVLDTDDWEGPGGWSEAGDYTWWQRRVFAWQERWGITHCDALTVASRTLEALAVEIGVEPETVFYLPNGALPLGATSDPTGGASVRAQRQLEQARVLLLYTRFFEFDAQRLVDVLARVFSEEPSAHMIVVGEGLRGEEKSFLSLVEDAGLSSRVTWVGWIDSEAVPAYFAAVDLAIYPLEDSLLNRARCPAKLVDLLSAGLAVVADDVGQVGEYVEHLSTGYVVSPGDTEAFARGVVQLLRDDDLRARLGEEARRRVSDSFDWARLAAVAERAYSA
jgi:glycosyltransferase involved in cell wall biosynthesis